MNTAEVKYLGGLRTEAIHLKSKVKILTDAPTDNNGKGEAFSPTDIVATALASCMITLMGIVAKNHQIIFENCEAKVLKIMGVNPRRIIQIDININIIGEYSNKEKKILENAALTCPVGKSLSSDIKQNISFVYVLH